MKSSFKRIKLLSKIHYTIRRYMQWHYMKDHEQSKGAEAALLL